MNTVLSLQIRTLTYILVHNYPNGPIREGNRNSLHYSCLENPMDGGAWWAAVYGVAQSQIDLAAAAAMVT